MRYITAKSNDKTFLFESIPIPKAVAAMGIAQKLTTVPMQMSMGFGQGIMPLVSHNYAAGYRVCAVHRLVPHSPAHLPSGKRPSP